MLNTLAILSAATAKKNPRLNEKTTFTKIIIKHIVRKILQVRAGNKKIYKTVASTISVMICDKEKEKLKFLISPFEAPQRKAKIKIFVHFYFSTIFWNTCGGKS